MTATLFDLRKMIANHSQRLKWYTNQLSDNNPPELLKTITDIKSIISDLKAERDEIVAKNITCSEKKPKVKKTKKPTKVIKMEDHTIEYSYVNGRIVVDM